MSEKSYAHNNPLAGARGEIDIAGIVKMLPHRYPFLLVDRVLEIIPGEKAVGLKNVSINEPFFQGHFPGNPVMPGVLLIEAMGQVAALYTVHCELGGDSSGKGVYFLGIDGAKFRKPVLPGDRILIETRLDRRRGDVWRFQAEASCEGQTCAEATITAMIYDRGEQDK